MYLLLHGSVPSFLYYTMKYKKKQVCKPDRNYFEICFLQIPRIDIISKMCYNDTA